MEYASTVWAPYTKSSVKKLEGIQLDLYDYSSSIISILNELNWPALAIRRQVSRLVTFYKIVNQSVAPDLPNEIVLFYTNTGRHNMKYHTSFSRIDVHKNSFLPAMIRLWNT